MDLRRISQIRGCQMAILERLHCGGEEFHALTRDRSPGLRCAGYIRI